jgi:hypothetical protein
VKPPGGNMFAQGGLICFSLRGFRWEKEGMETIPPKHLPAKLSQFLAGSGDGQGDAFAFVIREQRTGRSMQSEGGR